ncbi:ribosomal-processing cysteine protease Prp [Carboxydochorda subterranea]|uniref:Ribosomal processing cysteine protease Prp n=1 Tax=Carboxydichorda subterranea TaxID=3109565 RepID=A0ABZ1BZN1_9FIRM|nr:ribosomal-processing cysteine protease Prp [Limnochorda sp. L945t]WRP18227.1 ribosomal-processing cysteine protease Prp [Limnochorda sp. L945t]
MLTVEVCRQTSGAITGLRASGHAGWGPYGKDIVCAAASAIVQTAALAAVRYLGERAHLEAGEGLVALAVTSEPPAGGDGAMAWVKAQAALEAALWGLDEIVKQYPKHVRIVERGEDGGERRDGQHRHG